MKCKRCGKRKAKAKKCKFCVREDTKKRSRTKRGLAFLRYRKMIFRANENNWQEPDFSKEEFINWTLSDFDFNILHSEWVNSDYDKWLSPSLDRIDPKIPYLMSNLRWITWRENWEKGIHEDHKEEVFNPKELTSGNF